MATEELPGHRQVMSKLCIVAGEASELELPMASVVGTV